MMTSVTILGCGTSGGVPMISSSWGDCDPNNSKNTRKRSSIILNLKGYHLLVDVGPDFRSQYLQYDVDVIDGVLLTHTHGDHLNGIDDLRGVCNKMKKPLDFYVYKDHWSDVKIRFGYCFKNLDYQKYGTYFMPALQSHVLQDYDVLSLGCHKIKVQTFLQTHGTGITMGLRINNFAYSTDVNEFPDQSTEYFHNLDVWVLDCLHINPHPTHFHLQKILELNDRYQPKKMYLTHMDNKMDYDTLLGLLPSHIRPAYDGLHILL